MGAKAAGLLAGVMVVHRPDDEAVRRLVTEYRAYPLATRNPDGELSDTLRTGLEYLHGRAAGQDQVAVLICLGDQPMLRLDVIKALVDTWSRGGGTAIRPSYRESPGEPGHPMLVDQSLWHLANEMRGESGFGPVLARGRVTERLVPVAGRNPDVDTREDLAALDRPVEAPEPAGLPSILEAQPEAEESAPLPSLLEDMTP
jgi:CTP:molybdopterin cytidylyltransferase MocA